MTSTPAKPTKAIKLSSVKADLVREAEGDWIEFPDWPGVAFNVCSLYKPAYQTARDLLVQRLARKYKGKPAPAAVLAAEHGKLYCDHILNDWRGFDIKYSPSVALETLSDPAFRDVLAAVEWCAAELSKRDVEFVEDAAKNSGRPSAGA